MKAGSGRVVRVVAGCAAVALLAGVVWFLGADSGGQAYQSAEEIDALGELPDQLTPLDPDNPNPTGDDPSVVGTPPEFDPLSSAEDFLAWREQVREAGGSAGDPKAQPGEAAPVPEADPSSLLVTFADGTSDAEITGALDAAGVDGERIGETGIVSVDTGGPRRDEVAAALEAVDAVVSVDLDYIRRAARVPDDPALGAQRPALDTVHLPAAWDVADTGADSDVVVAVLDTGVDLDHPDLAPNLVPGSDLVNEDGDPSDDNGHGTHVAGIVGASTDNGAGVAGVAWNARVMPVKVLQADGTARYEDEIWGYDRDIVEGIHWATDHGADVINMSFGGYGVSDAIDTAVQYALDHGVLVVAAAGNDASKALIYPAAAVGVLGVTATDASGEFAWFSNHGPWYLLSAPGIDIRSTALAEGPTGAYASGSGTSFASPIVAGVAALLKERHPGWGWFDVYDELLRTARDAGPAGWDDAYGVGIVDASAALGVSPLGPRGHVDLTGDAGNLPDSARQLGRGLPVTASETIAYADDEDWFTVDPAVASSVTVTVTPPPTQTPGLRAAEMDPMIEVYDLDGLVGRADETFAGEPEQLTIDRAGERLFLRVRNYAASTSPGPYTVDIAASTSTATAAPDDTADPPDDGGAPGSEPGTDVTSTTTTTTEAPEDTTTTTTTGDDDPAGRSAFGASPAQAPTEGPGPWIRSASPGPHATGVAISVQPTVTLGREVDPASVNHDTVLLFDGRGPYLVSAAVALSGNRITITPRGGPLQPGVPYRVLIAGVSDPTGTELAFESIAFTTAGQITLPFSVSATYRPFRVDLDGNGYDDIFWYAPGSAPDAVSYLGPWGRANVAASVRGTYTPIVGDFDGNGYDDIFWYAPGSGTDVMWWNPGWEHRPEVIHVRGVFVPVAGDFDRNGYDDIVWYGPGTTPDPLWYFHGGGFSRTATVIRGTSHRVAAGDVNRDGYDDVVFHGPGTAGDSLWRGQPNGFLKGATPRQVTGTYSLHVLDFDADGYDEVLLHGSSASHFWRTGAQGLDTIQAAPRLPGDARPVTGELTGDLRDDLLSYVPGSGADRLYVGIETGVT